jgi:sRNA-binding regulator protein Hfq
MEPKKIKIKKPDGGSSVSGQQGNTGGPPKARGDKQDSLKILENTIKKLTNRFNQFGFNDSKEEEFLLENRGKEVVLELETGTVEGKLDSIDKYRIAIEVEGTMKYYYKHACVGYYVK